MRDGKYNIEVFDDGQYVDLPLCFFDLGRGSTGTIPNLDALQRVDQTSIDPEFLLHCRGFRPAATSLPAHWDEAAAIVDGVVAEHWNMPSTSRTFSQWKAFLKRTGTLMLIQVLDMTRFKMYGGNWRADNELLMYLSCHNLYVPVDKYRVEVLHEFCDEALRMLGALRAKKATITIRPDPRHSRNKTSTESRGVGEELGSPMSRE